MPCSLIKGWIALLNAPLTECEVSDDQRKLLADLFTAYHTFVYKVPLVKQSDFCELTRQLVETAFDLDPLEEADEHLRGIVTWLHANLPEVSLFDIIWDYIHFNYRVLAGCIPTARRPPRYPYPLPCPPRQPLQQRYNGDASLAL